MVCGESLEIGRLWADRTKFGAEGDSMDKMLILFLLLLTRLIQWFLWRLVHHNFNSLIYSANPSCLRSISSHSLLSTDPSSGYLHSKPSLWRCQLPDRSLRHQAVRHRVTQRPTDSVVQQICKLPESRPPRHPTWWHVSWFTRGLNPISTTLRTNFQND